MEVRCAFDFVVALGLEPIYCSYTGEFPREQARSSSIPFALKASPRSRWAQNKLMCMYHIRAYNNAFTLSFYYSFSFLPWPIYLLNSVSSSFVSLI
jgi:hypothetical protein